MKLEYRVWNPFRSKLAAAILGNNSTQENRTMLLSYPSPVTVIILEDLVVAHFSEIIPIPYFYLVSYTYPTSSLIFMMTGGIDGIHMKPGSKVLYLGAAAGTTVSHVSDIVGPTGCVYAVEFAHRPGRDLINMAKSRTNVIPIIEDARHPLKYRMLMGKYGSMYIVRACLLKALWRLFLLAYRFLFPYHSYRTPSFSSSTHVLSHLHTSYFHAQTYSSPLD